MGMKDVRDRAKRERQFYARDDLQQCVVCGRWFCRRRDNVCSRDSLAKLQEGQASTPVGGVVIGATTMFYRLDHRLSLQRSADGTLRTRKFRSLRNRSAA
jgi:hypothetical protein